MVQQLHCYPAAQASDLGFCSLVDGFDALGVGGSSPASLELKNPYHLTHFPVSVEA